MLPAHRPTPPLPAPLRAPSAARSERHEKTEGAKPPERPEPVQKETTLPAKSGLPAEPGWYGHGPVVQSLPREEKPHEEKPHEEKQALPGARRHAANALSPSKAGFRHGHAVPRVASLSLGQRSPHGGRRLRRRWKGPN